MFKPVFTMGLLYGRAGRLTAKNGGFRPGRAVVNLTRLLDHPAAAAGAAAAASAAGAAPGAAASSSAASAGGGGAAAAADLLGAFSASVWPGETVHAGPGRVVASYHRSPALYQIYERIRCLDMSETTMRPNPRSTPRPP
jgi:hypothetical protein